MTEIVVLGSGPSRNIRPVGVPICAVSSGHLYVRDCEMMATVDKARHFPQYDGRYPIHVPIGQYVKGWNPWTDGYNGDLDLMCLMMREKIEWCPGWADWKTAVTWATEYDAMPDFEDAEKPIGLGRVMNSMIFVVQVLHRLGYRRLHFVGCDMDELNYAEALVGMEWMYPRAKAAGHEWTVTAKTSRLARFIPVDTPNGYIPIHREGECGGLFRCATG